MITFFKNLWFSLKFEKAQALIREECGEVKEINGLYYAVLKNGLLYEIEHFTKFFNVRVFHNGKAICEFKFASDAKKVSIKKPKGVVDGEAIMARIAIKTALSQILSDSPFTRCEEKYFLILADSIKSQFTSDDLLMFFFERHYSSIGMVDYKLTLRHTKYSSYLTKKISIINGLIYEKTADKKLPAMSSKNLAFLDDYSDLFDPFFLNLNDKFFLVYFDLKSMHMINFVGEKIIERTSINYRDGLNNVCIESVESRNIHYYLESIMYKLIQLKASEHFFETCAKFEINIEDPLVISDEEIELFKMAIY